MEEKKNMMSYEKVRELEEEKEMRKNVLRHEIAQKISEARDQGDLTEDAEYDAAKEEQSENELRIIEIENILKNAEVYLEEDVAKDVVGLGSTVTLLDMEYDDEVVYKIVGPTEVDSLNGKISNESRVGKSLIGAKKGPIIEVEAPSGTIKYKIIKIDKPSGKGTKSTKKPEEKSTKKAEGAGNKKTAEKEKKPASKTTKKKADK